MPAAVAPMRCLEFPEKLIQSGRTQTAQALLKRMKAGFFPCGPSAELMTMADTTSQAEGAGAGLNGCEVTRYRPGAAHRQSHHAPSRVGRSLFGTWEGSVADGLAEE
jgi:hypothetical protein